jgi:hypothetical protein
VDALDDGVVCAACVALESADEALPLFDLQPAAHTASSAAAKTKMHCLKKALTRLDYRKQGDTIESLEMVMEQNLQQTIALLTHTPAALNALLRDLPEAWTFSNEGENTWNAFDVVGHLIYAERDNWMQRAKVILDFGETQAFASFDRLAQQRESQGKTLGQLLDEFARLRAKNLDELRALNLRPEDLQRRGRHPSLGVVTLSELLATWAAHDLTHLHQISRIMAHQYRQAVGPWGKYLGVLQCAGHSSAA